MKRLAMLFAVVVVLAAGCSRVPKDKWIVGKWEEIGGKQQGEFFANGNVTLLGRLQGKWRFLNDGQLCIEATILTYSVTQTYAVNFVDRDTMTLTDADDNVQKFKRMAGATSAPKQEKSPGK
jgi:hypothetical protein